MNAPMPTPTLHDILQQIESLQRDRAAQPQINLVELEGRIRRATEDATANPTVENRGELQALLVERSSCNTIVARIKAIDQRLAQLREQKEIAEYEQQKSQRLSAERHKQELAAEFRHNALAMVRSARKCMRAGVNVGKFSVGFLETDANGSFRLSDEMGFGPLRFEVLEAEAAAKAEQERMCNKYANEAAA